MKQKELSKTFMMVYMVNKLNKSTLDNSSSPLLNLVRPQGQIIDVKCLY